MAKQKIDRRALLRTLAGSTVAVGAATLAGGLPATAATESETGARLIPQGHLGIQLYSVRDKISQLGFAAVFEELSRIGYREVEFAGYTQGSVGAITPEQIRRLLDDNGLKAAGSHRGLNDFRTNLEWELDVAQILGMPAVGTASAPTGDRTIAGYQRAAAEFNAWGAAAAARGIKLYQHNHTIEFAFATDAPQVRLYDLFLELTDPRYVFLEMDILWAYGGARKYPGFRPVDYVNAHPERYPLFHVKDGVPLPDPQQGNSYLDVEFGAGQIPFTDFFTELNGGGRFEYLWEQDSAPNAQPNPPGSLGAAERSYQRMRELRSGR
ncbi:sugar phosphate isomerase/epimerase family protein [Micromonospora mirobrigensis]|uniref:Sugar phosphate isomerase/epimerase n=1 Tax=Micromonospora mirobrigensis TaxID=262898 RepID=A0A1C4WBJ3_9ACTN|nr:sugar phosphate isomerase/epimerase [Micromonospora mirobrigensis]SCE93499.1 Sugar phosphate isomerase/epimerase [Micromonospora mirobrigensis]